MGKDKDDEVEIRDITEAPEEVQESYRRLLSEGKIEFSPEALKEMEEHGTSPDEVIAMMRQAVGIKPQ